MNNQIPTTNNDRGTLTEGSRALMTSAAEVAGKQITEARNRLAAALDSGKDFLGRVKEKAVDSARATDDCVHEHPYQAMGVAFGLAAVIGYLIARRSSQ